MPRRRERLVERCDGIEVDGLGFSLSHVWRGEAVLRISGGADERVTDTDAFFRAWHPMLRPQPLVPEAERTARACEAWTREVMRRLEGERFPVITLKWFGRPRPVPSFLERHGVTGAFAADSAFLRGLGIALGLEPVVAPETDDPVGDLRAPGRAGEGPDRGRRHVRLLPPEDDRRGRAHEGPEDQAGDDRAAGRGARRPSDRPGDRLSHRRPRDACLAGRDPLGDPVPLLVAGPGVRADGVERFGELDCAAGILGQLRGPDLMPVLLNAADRPLFLGSRPTPFEGADGYPAVLEPLL